MSKKLKRAVIKEELVELTDDYKKAVILNQFIYWSERVNDFDEFIEEENKRKKFDEELELRQGWIFKSAKELAKETMFDLSPATMRKHIKALRDKDWIKERNNPNYEWDHTKQYRVEIQKIQQDLLKIGYSLDDYSINLDKLPILESKKRSKESKKRSKESKNRDQKNEGTISETTSEITNRDNNKYNDELDITRKDNGLYDYPEDFEEVWSKYPFQRGTKKATWEKWRDKRENNVDNDLLIQSAKNYDKKVQQQDRERQYVKRAETFFGPKDHWQDFVDENFELNGQSKDKDYVETY